MTPGLHPAIQNWDPIKALYKLRQYGYSIYGLHSVFDVSETLWITFFKELEYILPTIEWWGDLQMSKPTIAVRDSFVDLKPMLRVVLKLTNEVLLMARVKAKI